MLPLIISIIGAAAGILGGALSGRRQVRMDRERWKRETAGEFKTELRSTVRELATHIASAAHSMSWLCWMASEGPERLDREWITKYEDEIQRLMPMITGVHAVIAGMDYDVYAKIKPLVEDLVVLDANIGSASLRFVPGQVESAQELAKLIKPSNELEHRLPQVISDALRPYAVVFEQPAG